ncbi:MAG: SGNH/GDSL hydrolase family protein [Bacteroidota bacterium]|nr:SGNH/GDSL hydrolase family protein [Bacteroidota bacterium]
MHKGGIYLAFGDSISWTIPDDASAVGANLYSYIVWKKICQDYGIIKHLNKGYGGSRSGDLVSRLNFLALGIPYDLVTIQCGMNDCNPTITTLDTFKSNMETVINRLKQYRPNCEIIYCKIPPTNDANRLPNWSNFNSMIDTIVSDTGILKADFGNAWTADQMSTYSGGVHPNIAGHQVLANILYPVVQQTNFVKSLQK